MAGNVLPGSGSEPHLKGSVERSEGYGGQDMGTRIPLGVDSETAAECLDDSESGLVMCSWARRDGVCHTSLSRDMADDHAEVVERLRRLGVPIGEDEPPITTTGH
jgi:hypothetical protein